MTDKDTALDRNDLFLLMEAYRNNFESATTLLEQQKNLMDQFQQIIAEQKTTRESIDKVVDNLDVCAKEMQKYHNELKLGTTTIKTEVEDEIKKVGHKVNILWIGIGAIVIPITGFVVKVIDELSTLDEILHTVLKLSGAG